RFAAAARIHLRIDVATLDIEADRTGFAPEKLRARRHEMFDRAVGGGAAHDRKSTVALRHIQRDRDVDAIMDADFHFARFELRLRHLFSPRYVAASIGGQSPPLRGAEVTANFTRSLSPSS